MVVDTGGIPSEPPDGLEFQDWMQLIAGLMSDFSDSSQLWWPGVVRVSKDAYDKWVVAPKLTEGNWGRVNARACAMLLDALDPTVKSDIIARKANQAASQILFRLYTTYQPGGTGERNLVLSNLQNPHVVQDAASGVSVEGLGTVVAKQGGSSNLALNSADASGDKGGKGSGGKGQPVVHATPVLNMETFMQQAVQALRQLEANPPRNDAAPHAQPPQPQPEDLSTASQPSSTPNPSVKRLTIRSVMPSSCFPVSGPSNRDFLSSSPAIEPTVEPSPVASQPPLIGYALLDSGATHPMRQASSEEEWVAAEEVQVSFVGDQTTVMRLTRAGPLLLPPGRDGLVQPIVPMGAIIEQLGYKLIWSAGAKISTMIRLGRFLGRVAAVIGGPPTRTWSMTGLRTDGPHPLRSPTEPFGLSTLTSDERDLVDRDTGLFARMMWLHALATAGRRVQPNPSDGTSMVAFLLEQPQSVEENVAQRGSRRLCCEQRPVVLEYAVVANLR
eukprot:s4801_g3.t1